MTHNKFMIIERNDTVLNMSVYDLLVGDVVKI